MSVVYIGRHTTAKIAEELDKLGVRRPLLAIGKNLTDDSDAAEILEPVLSDLTPVIFSDFTPNPVFQEAMSGASLFIAEGCDGIVAIGGGSTMDVGKTINAFQAHPGNELDIVTGQRRISNRLVPLIAVPTTSGTGSEATQFAVIYIGSNKYSLDAEVMRPDVAVLDARFTDSLPADITASTGFDALCQSVESYWAKRANAESRRFAAAAIPILIANIAQAVNEPDVDCRDKMLLAAHYGGKAINISRTTAPHALSYLITHQFKVPHGHAVALTLGRFFEINEGLAREQGQEQMIAILRELYELLGVRSAREAETKWYELMAECGLESSLPELGISKQQHVDLIVNSVNLERLANHPFTLDADDLKRTLRLC
jgi:alcohol dehydrogenase class IV